MNNSTECIKEAGEVSRELADKNAEPESHWLQQKQHCAGWWELWDVLAIDLMNILKPDNVSHQVIVIQTLDVPWISIF